MNKKRLLPIVANNILTTTPISWLLRDEFLTNLPASGINNTPAEPGPGTRTVIDTNNIISINSGNLIINGTSAAGDRFYLDGITRTAGRILFFTVPVNTSHATNSTDTIGWANATAAGSVGHAIDTSTASGNFVARDNGTAAGPVMISQALPWKIAIVLRSSGAFWFYKGESTGNKWVFLWLSSLNNSATMYPKINMSAANAKNWQAGYFRVPLNVWLPTPLASDSFNRSNGALGSTDGAAHAEANGGGGLAWTGGSTWSISGNKVINTPTQGIDTVLNGGMEDGDPPTSWVALNTPVTHERSNVQAHSGSYSVHVVTDGNSEGTLQANVTPTQKTWYYFSLWMYRVNGYTYTTAGNYNFLSPTLNTWVNLRGVFNSGTSVNFGVGNDGTTTGEMYIDDVVVKPLNIAELFSGLVTGSSDVISDVNITIANTSQTHYPTGMVLCLDNPNNPLNYIVAYVGGDSAGGSSATLAKCIDGVITNLVNGAITPVANATLRVIKNGQNISIYYNSVIVGTVQTVGDNAIINNKIHGMFATHPDNSLDSYACWAIGSEGQYSLLDKYTK